MRDYLSPAKKMVERVIPHPAAARVFIMKRRALVFGMAATAIFALTLGFVSVRAITSPSDDSHENVVKSEGKTSTISTSNKTDVQAPKAEEGSMSQSTSTNTTSGPSSSESKTTVTINNEQVPVPENGSVQRTITSDNGTTHINVSTNSGSSGNTYSSSFTTNTSSSNGTSVSSSITSNSQSVNITTP